MAIKIILSKNLSKIIKVTGVRVGTLPGLHRVGHGLQCKAEGQETLTVRSPTSAGQPCHMRMRVAVCYYYPSYADSHVMA